MEEKEKFHITITDNETGEVRVDMNTKLILAAIDIHKGTKRIQYVNNCSLADVTSATYILARVIEDIQTDYPEVAALIQAYECATRGGRSDEQ